MSDEFTPPDSLPFHYRDNGDPCPWSGHVIPNCPNGCDHADHYSNDGHEACYDPPGTYTVDASHPIVQNFYGQQIVAANEEVKHWHEVTTEDLRPGDGVTRAQDDMYPPIAAVHPSSEYSDPDYVIEFVDGSWMTAAPGKLWEVRRP